MCLTQVDVIGHCVPLHQLHTMLLAKLSDDPPNVLPQWPEYLPLPVLRHDDNVVHAVPSNVRLALPLSHDGLLPERGGSFEGDRLISLARRDGRACSSLTARGGGLPLELFMKQPRMQSEHGSARCAHHALVGILAVISGVQFSAGKQAARDPHDAHTWHPSFSRHGS